MVGLSSCVPYGAASAEARRGVSERVERARRGEFGCTKAVGTERKAQWSLGERATLCAGLSPLLSSSLYETRALSCVSERGRLSRGLAIANRVIYPR